MKYEYNYYEVKTDRKDKRHPHGLKSGELET